MRQGETEWWTDMQKQQHTGGVGVKDTQQESETERQGGRDSTVMARSSSSRQKVLRSTPLTLLITVGRLSHKVN